MTSVKKNENLQDFKISAYSADSLCTTNLQNQRKIQKTLYWLPDKRLDYFLTKLKLDRNVQISFLIET